MKKFFKRVIIPVLVIILIIFLLTLNAGSKAKKINYGVTFSAPYAQSLGLDWKQTYTSILNDLHPKYVRLSAYWDSVEPQQDQYSFDDLDYQVSEAAKRNIPIILAVGRRLPRWPECHDPSWIGKLDQSTLDNAQLSYIETVVRKYSSDKNIAMWQVENEPFLGTFGICPPLNTAFLDKEIALVKQLDPSRQVLITDSGELSSWLSSSSRGDVFGTTFYRYVFSDKFKRYWVDPIPAWFYRLKGGYVRLLHPGKQIMIAELEAEPWTTAGIPNTPVSEQMHTMSMDHFNTITSIAASTGYNPQILWGAEWWYWMKTKQNNSSFWDRAKQLINNQ